MNRFGKRNVFTSYVQFSLNDLIILKLVQTHILIVEYSYGLLLVGSHFQALK